ncbi:MAG: hypothetical protein HY584_03045 [Candidatus Omnitrophica bacterium]|nr:hypothetical protein [Candidatus Omnitrophota bacterium]
MADLSEAKRHWTDSPPAKHRSEARHEFWRLAKKVILRLAALAQDEPSGSF